MIKSVRSASVKKPKRTPRHQNAHPRPFHYLLTAARSGPTSPRPPLAPREAGRALGPACDPLSAYMIPESDDLHPHSDDLHPNIEPGIPPRPNPPFLISLPSTDHPVRRSKRQLAFGARSAHRRWTWRLHLGRLMRWEGGRRREAPQMWTGHIDPQKDRKVNPHVNMI